MIKIWVIVFVLLFSVSSGAANEPYTDAKWWGEYLESEHTLKIPIIFVHGIAAGFEKWDKTATLIAGGGPVYHMRFNDSEQLAHDYKGRPPKIWVWNVSYYKPNVIQESFAGNLTCYAWRLDKIIQEIARITGQSQCVIVAHSMGGLVVRKYITQQSVNAQVVAKILTVGSPHEGVFIPIPIGGQLQDLAEGSAFLRGLNKSWRNAFPSENWGVIAGVDPEISTQDIRADTTDLGGIGFIKLQSAIPFGEWKDALTHIGTPAYNTPHFGFRLLVRATHNKLLDHLGTLEAISWVVRKPSDQRRLK